MNFKKSSLMDKLPDILKMEVGAKKKTTKEDKKLKSNLFTIDFNVPLDKIEKALLRSSIGILILFIVYSSFASLINKQIELKKEQAQESIDNTNSQIELVNNDIQNAQNKTSEYTSKINNLDEINKKLQENNRLKKSIPNLLNKLMYVMPNEVQLTSIQNTNSTHIEIQAQSKSYAQLGYLTASIKTNGILTNVISTSGQKENNIVTIKIEGDLP